MKTLRKILITIIRPLVISCLIVAFVATIGDNKNGSLKILYALDDGNHEARGLITSGIFHSLMFLGADPNTSNLGLDPNRTLLHDSVEYGDYEFTKLLLENGADPNISDETGQTPLTLALKSGYVQLGKILTKHGAQIDSKNDLGRTPLLSILAEPILYRIKIQVPERYEQRKQDAIYLIYFGANVHTQDNRKITPLMMAAKLGDEELVKEILNHGKRAKFLEEYDIEGRNAVNYAMKYKHFHLADFLEQYGLRGRLL